MRFKLGILLVLLIPALAISYYFGIALPANERAKLQFEKDKYAAEQAAKSAQNEERESARIQLQSCLDSADTEYWSYIKLNGTLVKGKEGTEGAYSTPTFVLETADKRKQNALAECHRQYDR